jgi:subtilisin family serine protease
MRKLALLLVGSAWVLAVPLRAPGAASGDSLVFRARIVVRLAPPLAEEAEAALDPSSGTVPRDGAPPGLAAFLDRRGVASLVPVHARRMAERKRRAASETVFVDGVRRRFAARTARWRGEARPPDLSRTFVVEREMPSRRELEALLKALALDPEVEHAEEDKVVRSGQAGDGVSRRPRIAAPAAAERTAGEGLTVAVVDTGIDPTHPDLAGSLWTNTGEVPGNGIDDDGNGYVDDTWGWNFVGKRYDRPQADDDPRDGNGHGTHVAGTVAGLRDGGADVAGAAPRAKVMAVRGLDDAGFGLDSLLAAAIVYAADNGADVINASWGGRGTSETVREAVDYAARLGVVLVAAAGNAGEDARGYYPVALDPVVAVAASDAKDAPAPFTNWGSRIDVAAPGVDILSARAAGTGLGPVVAHGYVRLSGTSMAAAHVSGLAALVLARHPEYSTEQVRQAIRVSAVRVGAAGFDDRGSGYGRVDAARAVGLGGALAARILEPPDGSAVTGLVVVRGLADGEGFARYELAYGEGERPAAWAPLAEGLEPAEDGPLGSFDAGTVPDGLYTLRLTVFDGAGRAYVDQRQVLVNYVGFETPAPPRSPASATALKPGDPVSLRGRATGPSFSRFRVEWAPGIHPASGWSARGIALEGDGLAPVERGQLATWDTAGFARAGYYTLRLLVDDAEFVSEARTLVYLEPDLLSGDWPRPLQPRPWPGVGVHAGAGTAGERLLALTGPIDRGTRLWRFSPDGSSVDALDDLDVSGYAALHTTATADLDGRPGDETLIAHPRFLRAVRPDGTSYTFPAPAGHTLVRAVPVVEDLDGTPGPEVLAVATAFRAGTGRLQAWTADGTPLAGRFPVPIPDRNLSLSNDGAQRLLVADLDGDGANEIVVADGPTATSFSLRLLAADGTREPWTDPIFDGDLDRLAAADLDGNGTLEVLVLAVRDGAPTLHVLEADGTPRPGWPVAFPVGTPGLAVADLDRDGRNEVVVAAGYELHVLDAEGGAFSPAWPRTGALYFGPPVAGDVDGDGRPEIVVPAIRAARAAAWPREASVPLWSGAGRVALPGLDVAAETRAQGAIGYYDCELVALRADGSLARSWRLLGTGGREIAGLPVPLVADVDGDGHTDVAVVQPVAEPGVLSLEEGLLTVLATGAAHDEVADDWPSVRHDRRNTSVLAPARPATGGVPPAAP